MIRVRPDEAARARTGKTRRPGGTEHDAPPRPGGGEQVEDRQVEVERRVVREAVVRPSRSKSSTAHRRTPARCGGRASRPWARPSSPTCRGCRRGRRSESTAERGVGGAWRRAPRPRSRGHAVGSVRRRPLEDHERLERRAASSSCPHAAAFSRPVTQARGRRSRRRCSEARRRGPRIERHVRRAAFRIAVDRRRPTRATSRGRARHGRPGDTEFARAGGRAGSTAPRAPRR